MSLELILLVAAGITDVALLVGLAVGSSSRKGRATDLASRQQDSPRQAALFTFAIWAALTVVGVLLVSRLDFYPTVGSDKGEEIASAFRLLTQFAVPVFSMVIAVLAYTLLRRQGSSDEIEDGLPLEGKGLVPRVWLGVTAGLTLLVIVYPGLTSLHEVVKNDPPEVVINIEGIQWTWLVGYPDAGLTNQRELVLPVDRTVRFNLTSRDVLHSFWVPSLLMKADVVPGRTISMTLRPTKTGEFETDPLIRLQCTELCGLGHSGMRIPVRIVSQAEFDAWLKQQQALKAP